MCGGAQCIGIAGDRIIGDPIGKVSDIGADVGQIEGWPSAFVKISAFHSSVDLGPVHPVDR
jgi:hypothetical protein